MVLTSNYRIPGLNLGIRMACLHMLLECRLIGEAYTANGACVIAGMFLGTVCLQRHHTGEDFLAYFAPVAILLPARLIMRLELFQICRFEVARHALVNFYWFLLLLLLQLMLLLHYRICLSRNVYGLLGLSVIILFECLTVDDGRLCGAGDRENARRCGRLHRLSR